MSAWDEEKCQREVFLSPVHNTEVDVFSLSQVCMPRYLKGGVIPTKVATIGEKECLF